MKVQFPGSSVADSSQFLLAECRFQREEYLLAAEEFLSLKRNMSTSNLISKAQFSIALCYYNLSPRSSLDQRYTTRAIDEFQAFVEYYPTDELVQQANAKIQELNERLAKKDYDTAELYMTMGRYRAAAVYFESVAEKYHDTPYAERSLVGTIRSLVARKKYADAKEDVKKFNEKYPSSSLRDDVASLGRTIDEHLRENTVTSQNTQKKRP